MKRILLILLICILMVGCQNPSTDEETSLAINSEETSLTETLPEETVSEFPDFEEIIDVELYEDRSADAASFYDGRLSEEVILEAGDEYLLDVDGRELRIFINSSEAYYTYDDIRYDLFNEGLNHVKVYSPEDFDDDGAAEVVMVAASGARGGEQFLVIKPAEGKLIEADMVMPELSCLMRKNRIVIISIPEYDETFAFDASRAYPADYFWDANGEYIHNEYYQLDEEGNYYVKTWFNEAGCYLLFSDDKYVFTRCYNATFGSGSGSLFHCYETFTFEDDDFVLLDRFYY